MRYDASDVIDNVTEGGERGGAFPRPIPFVNFLKSEG